MAMRLDVSNEADWQNAIETALVTCGRLDVLVNNAGVSFAKPFSSPTTTTCGSTRRPTIGLSWRS